MNVSFYYWLSIQIKQETFKPKPDGYMTSVLTALKSNMLRLNWIHFRLLKTMHLSHFPQQHRKCLTVHSSSVYKSILEAGLFTLPERVTLNPCARVSGVSATGVPVPVQNIYRWMWPRQVWPAGDACSFGNAHLVVSPLCKIWEWSSSCEQQLV